MSKGRKYTVILTCDHGNTYPFRVTAADSKGALHIAARRISTYLGLARDRWVGWIGWANCPYKQHHGYVIAKRSLESGRPYNVTKRWSYEIVENHDLIVYQLPLPLI